MKLEFLDDFSDGERFPRMVSNQLVRQYDFDPTQSTALSVQAISLPTVFRGETCQRLANRLENTYLEKKLTMPPKFVSFLTLVLSASLVSQAQDRRTLQISETDTILLNPTSIEYVISTGTTPHFPSFEGSQNKKATSESEAPAASMQKIKSVLQDHHIAWGPSRERGYVLGRSNFIGGDTPITITVHSEAELKSVYALLSPLSGISATIGQVEYEPMPDRVSVYKTLYQRALAAATGMAAVSGKTLGDLVSVEEPQDLLWSMHQMMDAMEPATNFVAEMSGNARPRLQKKEEVKLLFKFELK